jgi:type IV secretion system protein VirD4
MLGTCTETSVSHSHGTSHGKGGGGSNSGSNEAPASRPLMYPQELRLLGRHKQIVVLEGHRPILCDKAYWDQDKVLRGRKMAPAKVQPLDVKLHVARVQQQVRPLRPDEGVKEPIPAERLAINTALLPPLKAQASNAEIKALVTGFWAAMGGEPLDPSEGEQPPADAAAQPEAVKPKKPRKPRVPKAAQGGPRQEGP